MHFNDVSSKFGTCLAMFDLICIKREFRIKMNAEMGDLRHHFFVVASDRYKDQSNSNAANTFLLDFI